MRWPGDTDGTGNYLLLTHKHVAQLSPHTAATEALLGSARPPLWVLYHSFSISKTTVFPLFLKFSHRCEFPDTPLHCPFLFLGPKLQLET